MPATVRTLVETPELELTFLAGAAGLDRPIRWVHVSEVEDPTPWLKGGEFLMTTALHVRDDAAVELFFQRLADTGLAGVGFGTGVTFDEVPEIWRRMADVYGIALVDIPITTPYVAISELVSHRLTQEQHEALQRALNVQRDLTKAAARPGGAEDVVVRLAAAIGGWVAVTDLNGAPRLVQPEFAKHRLVEFGEDLRRCRDAPGGAAVSVAGPAESVLIQQLGARDRVRSLLVVGKPGDFAPYERMIVSSAVTLLSLDADRAHTVSEAERWFRDRFVAELVNGSGPLPQRVQGLRSLGFGSAPLRVAYLDIPVPQQGNLATLVEDHLRTFSIGCVAGPDDARPSGTWAVVDADDDTAATCLNRLVSGLRPAGRAGLGRAVSVDELSFSARQATLAFAATQRLQQPVATFDDLDFADLLPGLLPPDTVQVMIDSYLGPLDRADPDGAAGLRSTLREFLAANGTWERAAARLGLHRHTLRHRIARIERLLNLDLTSADVRAALWLALASDSAKPHATP